MTKMNTADELHVRLSTDHSQVGKASIVLQKQGARGNTAVQMTRRDYQLWLSKSK